MRPPVLASAFVLTIAAQVEAQPGVLTGDLLVVTRDTGAESVGHGAFAYH